MRTAEPTEWVVYRTTNADGVETGPCTICSQDEWVALQKQPNPRFVLIRDLIESEAAAERVARSIPIPIPPLSNKRKGGPAIPGTSPLLPGLPNQS